MSTREEQENLYKNKMSKLQSIWGNPIADDYGFVSDWSDNELNKNLIETIRQIRFEKYLYYSKIIIKYLFYLFVILGVVGILVFGFKQLV